MQEVLLHNLLDFLKLGDLCRVAPQLLLHSSLVLLNFLELEGPSLQVEQEVQPLQLLLMQVLQVWDITMELQLPNLAWHSDLHQHPPWHEDHQAHLQVLMGPLQVQPLVYMPLPVVHLADQHSLSHIYLWHRLSHQSRHQAPQQEAVCTHKALLKDLLKDLHKDLHKDHQWGHFHNNSLNKLDQQWVLHAPSSLTKLQARDPHHICSHLHKCLR